MKTQLPAIPMKQLLKVITESRITVILSIYHQNSGKKNKSNHYNEGKKINCP